MRKRILSLLLASLMLLTLSACDNSEVLRKLDAIDDRLDKVEHTLEESMENRYDKDIAPAPTPVTGVPSLVDFPLSEEEARDIALKHAELDVSEAERLHIHLDRDDRLPEYEVDFFYGGYEYEYEIDARTGDIISFDKDKQ